MRTSGGGLKIRTRGEGVKNGQTFADVLYGWLLGLLAVAVMPVAFFVISICFKTLLSILLSLVKPQTVKPQIAQPNPF